MLLLGMSSRSGSEEFYTRNLINLMCLIKRLETKFVSDINFNIQDLQWNLCEFDKYEGIRTGKRGRRRRYP